MNLPQDCNPRWNACAGCTLLCDDFQLAANEDPKLCEKGQSFFEDLATRSFEPQYWIGHERVSVARATEQAIRILQRAKAPLICGLEWLSVQSQALAVRLAQACRGYVDLGPGRPVGQCLAFQQTGNVTATLGEIRDRATVVVFLYADPDQSHPRLWERLRCDEKKIIVMGTRLAHRNVIEGSQFEASPSDAMTVLLHLQAFFQSEAGGSKMNPAWLNGIAHEQWDVVCGELAGHERVALVVGQPYGLDLSEQQTYWTRAFRTVQAMNDRRRVWLLALRDDANALAAENAMAALTGFPRAVSFQSGFPEYEPARFNAARLIETNSTDARLVVGESKEQRGERFSGETIWIQSEPVLATTVGDQDVTIVTPFAGWGDWVRLDDVCLPLVQGVTECPTYRFLLALVEGVGDAAGNRNG